MISLDGAHFSFPSSQPSDCNFFPLKCMTQVNTHLWGLHNSEQILVEQEGDWGNIASSWIEILWHSSQVYNMCGLSFMKALHFSFPLPLTVGLLLWFFCNWEFIFKYYIVIMTRGSFLSELHSYICNFLWLMGKQLPHQSFSPGPIICQHQIKPHIAMQIIVPRDLAV